MFEGHKEFLDEVLRKGAKIGKKMVYEKRKRCVKIFEGASGLDFWHN
jgi:hypothetical protein